MFSFLLSFSSIAEYQSGISTIASSYKMSEIPDLSCYGSTVYGAFRYLYGPQLVYSAVLGLSCIKHAN